MMRVQTQQSGMECILRVEGEIEGLAADELEGCWKKLSCIGSLVTIDFTSVLFIDQRARKLLRTMHQSGVKFSGARLAIQDILDEITVPATSVDNDV